MEKAKPVLSDVEPKWYQKKHVLIDLAVIVIVLLIIAFIWWIGHRPKPEPASKVPQYSGQALVDEVNKKYGLNDYAGAINLIKGQKSINEIETQLLLANAYSNQGNQASALEIYDKLHKDNKLTASSLAAAATLAEQKGDNAKALDYYKAAVARVQDDTNRENEDLLPMYQAKVDELTKKVSQ